METRPKGYVEIFEKFYFLINIETEPSDDTNLFLKQKNLQDFYNKDTEDTFPIECAHLESFI